MSLDRLPRRRAKIRCERLETGERRPFPQRREDAQVERRQRGRHIAAKPGEDEPIAKPQGGGLSLQVAEQRPFAHEVEAGAGPIADEARADTESNDEKRKARYQADSTEVQNFYRVNRYPKR